MTAVLLTPLTGQFFDNNGNPLNGGLVYSYVAGTGFGTPQATYTNALGTTPAANPVVLNSAGRADIWGAGTYDFKITDSLGNTIDTISSVTAIFGSGDMTKAVYDPANVSEQLVGLVAVQTLTNKTITKPNIIGTTTNDNAAAGSVGELIESEIQSGSPVSISNNVAKDITSISLTAGDWDVWGTIAFIPAASTVIGIQDSWINITSATPPVKPNKGAYLNDSRVFPASSGGTFPIGMKRLSLSGTTTVYLSTQTNFTVSTCTAYGYIGARRVR